MTDDHAPPARTNGRAPSGRAAPGGSTLDEISKKIIEQLQQDGRRSYAAIGKAVGLSEAAVRQRVQRLTDSGVIQIVAVTDPAMIGFSKSAMIGIKCEGDLELVATELAAMEEIDYIIITMGSFDLLVELICRNDEHMLEVLNRIRAVPSVISSEGFTILKIRKETYHWGTL
jgi:Lrp/AsnC family transcriptional regulator, regulator for asnA, asnC and gidA